LLGNFNLKNGQGQEDGAQLGCKGSIEQQSLKEGQRRQEGGWVALGQCSGDSLLKVSWGT